MIFKKPLRPRKNNQSGAEGMTDMMLIICAETCGYTCRGHTPAALRWPGSLGFRNFAETMLENPPQENLVFTLCLLTTGHKNGRSGAKGSQADGDSEARRNERNVYLLFVYSDDKMSNCQKFSVTVGLHYECVVLVRRLAAWVVFKSCLIYEIWNIIMHEYKSNNHVLQIVHWLLVSLHLPVERWSKYSYVPTAAKCGWNVNIKQMLHVIYSSPWISACTRSHPRCRPSPPSCPLVPERKHKIRYQKYNLQVTLKTLL